MAQDILLDSNFDLLTSSGDLTTGLSDQQHIALTVIVAPGHFKENPFHGFNVSKYKGSNVNPAEMRASLQEHLSADNGVLNKMVVENGYVFDLDAERTVT